MQTPGSLERTCYKQIYKAVIVWPIKHTAIGIRAFLMTLGQTWRSMITLHKMHCSIDSSISHCCCHMIVAMDLFISIQNVTALPIIEYWPPKTI